MPTTLTLEALTVPRKTYELNAVALRDLATIQAQSPMTETAAIHLALRNLAEMLDRGIPVYVASLPQEPEPPTSAPAAARRPLPRVVEKGTKAARRSPTPGASYSERRKR